MFFLFVYSSVILLFALRCQPPGVPVVAAAVRPVRPRRPEGSEGRGSSGKRSSGRTGRLATAFTQDAERVVTEGSPRRLSSTSRCTSGTLVGRRIGVVGEPPAGFEPCEGDGRGPPSHGDRGRSRRVGRSVRRSRTSSSTGLIWAYSAGTNQARTSVWPSGPLPTRQLRPRRSR